MSSLASRTRAQKVKLVKTDNQGLYFDLQSHDWVKRIPSLNDRIAGQGGTISWHTRREAADPGGNAHSFYDQHYTPPKDWVSFPEGIPEKGFPLIGGEIAMHQGTNGVVYAANGAYYPDVVTLLTPTITTAEAALSTAISKALEAGYSLVAFNELEEKTKSILLSDAHMDLHPVKAQQSVFGLTWVLSAPRTDGDLLELTIDAESGELLNTWDGMMPWDDPCTPDSDEETQGQRVPLNPGISQSSGVFATTKHDSAFFDAHAVRHSRTPEILCYQGDFQSAGCHSDEYSLLNDVPEENSTPYFGGTETLQAAGDAQFYARTAFDTWARKLGFFGPDGSIYSIAKMTMSAFCTNNNNGAAWTPVGNDDTPAGGIYFCAYTGYPGVLQFNAAQDIVAHEWGHSLLTNTTGWQYDQIPEGLGSLQEGWADVLGQGIEWLSQARSADLNYPTPGQADWMLGEDTKMVFRRADSTNPVGGDLLMARTDNPNVPYLDFNFLSFHKADIADLHDNGDYDAHFEGNKANVVFYLMVEGNVNPGYRDCAWGPCIDLVQDHHVDVTLAYSYLGLMLVDYTTSTDGWEDLADNLNMVDSGFQNHAPISGGFHLIHIDLEDMVPCSKPSPNLDALRAGHQAFDNIGYSPHTHVCGEDS